MEKKKKTILAVGIAVIFLIMTIAIVMLLILLNKQGRMEQRNEQGDSYVLKEETYQQIVEDMESEVREGYFETYMNTSWTFPDGTSETTDAVLGNAPNNTKPIRCEVLLADTNESVYATGVLPVGAVLSPFKLDKDLDAGTYEATCMVYLLDELEDGTYKDYSNAGFHVTIIVEN